MMLTESHALLTTLAHELTALLDDPYPCLATWREDVKQHILEIAKFAEDEPTLRLVASENGDRRKRAEVNADEIVDAYRRVCVPRGAPDLRELTLKRRQKIAQRIREHPAWEWWDELFGAISKSSFLFTGVFFSFDWIIDNDTNAVKITEGRYFDGRKVNAPARR